MIKIKCRAEKAAAAIEYTALIFFLLSALVVFDRYILRAFWGQWRKAGEVFGHGKQYDPRGFGDEGKGGGTLECMFIYQGAGLMDCNSSGECTHEDDYNACMAIVDPMNLNPHIYELQCRHDNVVLTDAGVWVRQPCFDKCLDEGGSQSGCITNCGSAGEPLVGQYCV